MTNPQILRVLRNAVQDERREKACLIEDVIKVKKLLFGLGDTQHDEFKTDKSAVELYDLLHDMDMTALRLMQKTYEKRVNEIMLSKMLVYHEG
jgi:hypothetical protein